MHGILGPGTLIALFRVLFAEQKSGVLEIVAGPASRKLLFQKGIIKFATTTVPEERLGEHLVRIGKLRPADLEKATRQVGRGERLGQILVRLGLLGPEDLQRHARDHILQIIYACFAVSGGQYRYEQVDVPLGQEIKAGLSMAAIIMEGVRRMNASEAAAALGSGDRVLRPTTDARLRSQPISLRPQEGFLLSRVDGRASVNEIVTVSPLPAEETLRTLAGLWCAGLIEDPIDPSRLPFDVAASEASAAGAAAPPPAAHVPAPSAPPARSSAAQAAAPRPAAAPPPRATAPASGPRPAASPASAPPPPPAPRPASPSAASAPPRRDAGRPVPGRAPARAPGAASAAARAGASSTAAERARELAERHAAAQEQNLYDMLGVAQTADEAEVRRAYYGLAKRLHPDRFQGPELQEVHQQAEKLFAMLTEAYNVLCDADARRRYDEERAAPERESTPNLQQEQSNLARQNFLHGKALLQQGQFHNAITFLENAVQQEPGKADYIQTLASVQMRNPRWREDAERNFKRALEIDPSLVACYIGLGQIYRKTHRDELAERMFREALRWDPEHPVAQKELAGGAEAKAGAGIFKGLFKK